jgi:hypothetical protein
MCVCVVVVKEGKKTQPCSNIWRRGMPEGSKASCSPANRFNRFINSRAREREREREGEREGDSE